MLERVRVCIVDYGSGNVTSVYNVLRSLCDARVSNDENELDLATHLVLPGVGAFGAAMGKLRKLNLIDYLARQVLEKKKPFLGICVGMQILADVGYEYGSHQGLGWISGEVKKLESNGLSLPHIGWNNCKIKHESSLLKGIQEDMDFYFVHSYSLKPINSEYSLASCEYGQEFTAVVGKGNIYGVQFHPEKSQKTGRLLIQNFLSLLN